MLSAASWAEWTEVYAMRNLGNVYVDFDNIRKVNGMVYYWQITDLLEPDKWGTMSSKSYFKVDCPTLGVMLLSMSIYKLPMAEGNAERRITPDRKWTLFHGGVLAPTLEAVCAH